MLLVDGDGALLTVTVLGLMLVRVQGLMIDSARHFIPVDQIEKTIKLMWIYKFNTLQ